MLTHGYLETAALVDARFAAFRALSQRAFCAADIRARAARLSLRRDFLGFFKYPGDGDCVEIPASNSFACRRRSISASISEMMFRKFIASPLFSRNRGSTGEITLYPVFSLRFHYRLAENQDNNTGFSAPAK